MLLGLLAFLKTKSDLEDVHRSMIVFQVDFEALEDTLNAMEKRCKNSWDHLKLIAKHESKAAFRSKLPDFLMSCARKIITLKTVHSRLKNRLESSILVF